MTLKTKLLKHQIEAVSKLQSVKVGALYMEMGTGKTRTAIELIHKRLIADKVDSVLWLCPCAIKVSIAADIDKHCSNMPVRVEGIETLSSSVRVNSELLELVKRERVYLIVDESLLVKNHSTKRTCNITRLASECKYKLILNGTPISRCEKDLFSQWQILDWRILGYKSFWSFAANHLEYDERDKSRIRRVLNTDYLAEKIAPYTYQVLKQDCITLPTKRIYDAAVYLTPEQNEHYQKVLDDFLILVDENRPETIYRMFSALQQLISGRRIITPASKPMWTKPFFADDANNPRLMKLSALLSASNGKVIVWCNYNHEIESCYNLCTKLFGAGAAVKYFGGLTKRQRTEALRAFQCEAKVFIANKACGGLGLNLQFCNEAIYYSNDWNYATRIQSEDRIHRIGQERVVEIVDIYTCNTIDHRIHKCLSNKESLIDSFKNELAKKNNLKVWLNS